MKEQIKPHAVFLDIDGTTLSTVDSERGLPSALLCEVIREGQKNGHVFFINSGRDIGIIPREFIEAGGFDGVCGGMGIYAEYRGKVLSEDVLSDEVLNEWIDYCVAHGESLVFDSGEKNDSARYSFGDGGFLNAQHRADTKEEFFRMVKGKKFHHKVTVPYTPNDEFAEFLNRYINLIYCSASRDCPSYAEGSKIGRSKGTAIDTVCKALSIPIERSIAIGDSENDLGMLLTAGVSVAMGTAPDRVKKECDMVTDSVDNDGAAKALMKLLEIDVHATV